MQMWRRLPLWFVLVPLVGWYFIFFCQKTLLTASDLGRHITNGRVIMESGNVFSTNLYSYTQPDRLAPNHHWLFGVIVYGLEQVGGFNLLTLLSAILYAAAVGLVCWYVGSRYGKLAMVVAGLAVLPLITDRAEVRPEAFSLFFFATNFITLLLWQAKKIPAVVVATILFAVSVAWVNIHIFFFLEFTILAAFGLQAVVQRNWGQLRMLVGFGVATVLGTLCNPLFITGALYPFRILQEYGYPVAENQTPFFYLLYHTRSIHYYLLGLLLISVVLAIPILYKQWRTQTAVLFLFVLFLGFTCKLIRFANFFALIDLVLIGYGIHQYKQRFSKIYSYLQQHTAALSGVSLLSFVVGAGLLATGLFTPAWGAVGLGLYPGVQRSAEFYKSLNVTGPIFNNFDIGGYLIYHLYPDQKVFVDNRAEAYSSEFLQEYKQAQLDPSVWEKLDAEYHFGAIYFNRLENTDWSQNFLITTLRSSEWAPIYVDPYTIIFIRDIPEHQALITQYRLPNELFTVVPSK